MSLSAEVRQHPVPAISAYSTGNAVKFFVAEFVRILIDPTSNAVKYFVAEFVRILIDAADHGILTNFATGKARLLQPPKHFTS